MSINLENWIGVMHVVGNGDLWAVFDGGGGYGDVLERYPEMVLDDLRNGVISHRLWPDAEKTRVTNRM